MKTIALAKFASEVLASSDMLGKPQRLNRPRPKGKRRPTRPRPKGRHITLQDLIANSSK